MPLDTPFKLGPFCVDKRGRLEPQVPGESPRFQVAWRGLAIHARLNPGADGNGTLQLGAVVGRVPSTAGEDTAANRARRGEAFALLDGLRGIDSGWRLRLLADHRISMEVDRAIGLPASAGDLLAQVTWALLDLAPYLDLLAEAGLTGAASGGGAGASPTTAGTAKI